MGKKKSAQQYNYVLANGEVYKVISETGKYYICEGDTQFRKSAKRGTLVKADKESEE